MTSEKIAAIRWAFSQLTLPASSFKLLASIVANSDGRELTNSQADLALNSHLSISTVQRSLDVLERRGKIEIHNNSHRNGAKLPCLFILRIEENA